MSRRNGTRKLFKFAKQDDAVLNSIEELNTGLFTTLLFVVCVALPHSPHPIGSLRQKNGDGNNNGKKAIDLKQNNSFARASRIFVHNFAVTAWLRRAENCLISRFMENVNTTDNHFLFLFLNLDTVF